MHTSAHLTLAGAAAWAWLRARMLAGPLVLLLFAAPAAALVRPAQTIDGPSTAILGLGGIAMAPDGSGGLVYLKLDQGEPHVFVSQFSHDRWSAPVRVDTALSFDSSWPAIGAGNDGRLVVIWAQSYAQDVNGNHFRAMYSAALKPGSRSFGSPIVFDQGLRSSSATGDEATAELNPSLSMNAVGKAFLAYHVVSDPCAPDCSNGGLGTIFRPGDVFASVRVARFNGETWSVLGDVNRNPAFSVRPGTAQNSPRVVIDAKGNGVVAFQEPDNTGFDRVWARRLFGSGIGRILPVSAQTLLGAPVNGDADAFSLAGGTAGAASVAYRQQTGPGSVFATTRVLVNSIATPSSLLADPSQFAAALPVDHSLGGLGAPAVAVAEPSFFATAFAGAGAAQSGLGDTTGQTDPAAPTPTALGAMTGSAPPGVTIGPDGSVVTAWPSTDRNARPLVAIAEDVAQTVDGAIQYQDARAQVAAGFGGPISDLTVAGDGFGDALVGFEQGVAAGAQIAGALVQGPPQSFAVYPPAAWVRRTAVRITWDPAFDGLSGVRYTVTVDGVPVARGLTGLADHLDPRGLQDGIYQVVVIATDGYGQQRLSASALLEVDDQPPRVLSVHARGARVTVRLSDGPVGRDAGVDLTRSWVRFGDGSSLTRAVTELAPALSTVAAHRYHRAGTYTVTVHAVDQAGNARTTRYRVSVT